MITNNLILFSDSKDQKLHEQNVVKWVEDDLVKLCPECAKSFNISRRRHHCRLCGAIMCHSCSKFLEPNYANQLVSPVDLETSQLLSIATFSGGNQGKLQKRPSIVSLPALSTSTHEAQVRVCQYCKELLDIRNQQMCDIHSKPSLCSIYDKYRESVAEAEKLVKQYYDIINSLRYDSPRASLKKFTNAFFRNGETSKVDHDHGVEVRAKIMLLAQTIDLIRYKFYQFI